MATFDAIRDVTLILRRVLDDGLQSITASCQIHDLINQPGPGRILALTLYEIAEDASSRNRPDLRTVLNGQVVVRRSPASLVLRYMLSAWSGDTTDDQRILGRAVQILYDKAILAGPDLGDPSTNWTSSLFARDEAIALTMVSQTIEDRTHVWRAYDRAYRLSVNYEVRVVKIDATRERATNQVRSRHLHHGVLEESP